MRRHEPDVFSLVAGLVFVAVALGHILDEAALVAVDGRWVLPVVLVTLGVASLAALVRGSQPGEGGASAAEQTGSAGDSDDTLVLHPDPPDGP